MEDKLAKVKAEIKRLQDGLMDAQGRFRTNAAESAYHTLCHLKNFINSMQEECNITGIKSKEVTGKLKECIDNITDESLTKARKQLQEELVNGGLDLGCGVIWKDEKSASWDLEKVVEEIVDPTVLNAYGVKEIANRLRRTMMDSVSEIDFEAEVKKLWMEINTGHSYSIVDSYNIFYGLCMDIVDWQKEQQNIIEPTGDEQVKESLIFKHEDKTCKENGNSLTQEPVSEDLEKEIDSYFAKWLQGASEEGCFNPDSQLVSIYDCHRIARHFANWQKQKDKAKVLTEEQCRKIRDDAFYLGKDAIKQQMMKDAVKVSISNASIVSLPVNCNLKVGDKVLIIKED